MPHWIWIAQIRPLRRVATTDTIGTPDLSVECTPPAGGEARNGYGQHSSVCGRLLCSRRFEALLNKSQMVPVGISKERHLFLGSRWAKRPRLVNMDETWV